MNRHAGSATRMSRCFRCYLQLRPSGPTVLLLEVVKETNATGARLTMHQTSHSYEEIESPAMELRQLLFLAEQIRDMTEPVALRHPTVRKFSSPRASDEDTDVRNAFVLIAYVLAVAIYRTELTSKGS